MGIKEQNQTWTIGEIILFVPFLKGFLTISFLSRGKTIALYQVIFSLMDFIAPVIGANLVKYFSYNILWIMILYFTLLSSILMFLAFKKVGFWGTSYNK